MELINKMVNQIELAKLYKQNLEESIVAFLAKEKNIAIEAAMDIYYKSKLCTQINEGVYGIENLDYKVLVYDIIENEAHLF